MLAAGRYLSSHVPWQTISSVGRPRGNRRGNAKIADANMIVTKARYTPVSSVLLHHPLPQASAIGLAERRRLDSPQQYRVKVGTMGIRGECDYQIQVTTFVTDSIEQLSAVVSSDRTVVLGKRRSKTIESDGIASPTSVVTRLPANQTPCWLPALHQPCLQTTSKNVPRRA